MLVSQTFPVSSKTTAAADDGKHLRIYYFAQSKVTEIPAFLLPSLALGATCDMTQPCSPAVRFISQWWKYKCILI
jgi:hypothetical protein